jgi:hypothetical protein
MDANVGSRIHSVNTADACTQAAAPPFRGAFGHQPRPDQACFFVGCKHAAGKQGRGAFRAGKPGVERATLAVATRINRVVYDVTSKLR